MLIVGAKGFAKEVLEVLYQNEYKKDIAFYDDVNSDVNDTCLISNISPIPSDTRKISIS